MTRRVLKQYGMPRTGTNYLGALMSDNFMAFVAGHELGNKHQEPVDPGVWLRHNKNHRFYDVLKLSWDAHKVRVVVSIKSPYGSVFSYMNYTRNHTQEIAYKYCKVTEERLLSWLPICDVVVRYEDLIEDPLLALSAISAATETHFSQQPVDIIRRVESNGRRVSKPHDRKYWRERKYLSEMSRATIDTVSDACDWDLWTELGYERLS